MQHAGPTDGEDSNNYVVLSTRMGTNDWQDVLYFDPDGAGPVRSFDPEVWIAPDGKLHWTWTDREDMTAYVSDDDGATWKGGLLLHKGQCAYPDGDQAPDGTIRVTFDGNRYKKQEIVHVSFAESDVRRSCFESSVVTIGLIGGNATPAVAEAVRKLPDGGTLRFEALKIPENTPLSAQGVF